MAGWQAGRQAAGALGQEQERADRAGGTVGNTRRGRGAEGEEEREHAERLGKNPVLAASMRSVGVGDLRSCRRSASSERASVVTALAGSALCRRVCQNIIPAVGPL